MLATAVELQRRRQFACRLLPTPELRLDEDLGSLDFGSPAQSFCLAFGACFCSDGSDTISLLAEE